MTEDRRIFIAGNGPSLKELDFRWLRDRPWLGMNAAYRHWDRINIYPAIYCCLDPVVARSHAREILRLHRAHRIHRFFLSRDILEEIPDFPRDERVQFLEDLVEADTPETAIFRTPYSDKITTGAWAARYAIHLGFRDITLGGIDCSYVELIDGAERTGSAHELRIQSQVGSNPNYFFDDYQAVDDRYQVPNPELHRGNLHLQAFEALNIDIARLRLDVRIRNASKASRLHRFGIYEYEPLAEALGFPELQAVAVALADGGTQAALRAIALWDTHAFHPLRADSPLLGKITLRLCFDGGTSPQAVAALEQAWRQTIHLRSLFGALQVDFLDLPSDLVGTGTRRPPDLQNRLRADLRFAAISLTGDRHRNTLVMAHDSVPTRADWLSDLDRWCQHEAPFWIAAAMAPVLATGRSSAGLAYGIPDAICATGNPHFTDFLSAAFVPALQRALACSELDDEFHLLAALREESKTTMPASRTGGTTVPGVDRFRALPLACDPHHAAEAVCDDALIAMLEGDCALVRSQPLAGLLAAALETEDAPLDIALQRRFRDSFLRNAPGAMRAVHVYSNLPDACVQHFDRARAACELSFSAQAAANTDPARGGYMVFPTMADTKGHRIVCQVTIVAQAEQSVSLKFFSQGSTTSKADHANLALPAGQATTVELVLNCVEDHPQLDLFVKPIADTGGSLSMACVVIDLVRMPSGPVAASDLSAALAPLYASVRMAQAAIAMAMIPADVPAPGPSWLEAEQWLLSGTAGEAGRALAETARARGLACRWLEPDVLFREIDTASAADRTGIVWCFQTPAATLATAPPAMDARQLLDAWLRHTQAALRYAWRVEGRMRFVDVDGPSLAALATELGLPARAPASVQPSCPEDVLPTIAACAITHHHPACMRVSRVLLAAAGGDSTTPDHPQMGQGDDALAAIARLRGVQAEREVRTTQALQQHTRRLHDTEDRLESALRRCFEVETQLGSEPPSAATGNP